MLANPRNRIFLLIGGGVAVFVVVFVGVLLLLVGARRGTPNNAGEPIGATSTITPISFDVLTRTPVGLPTITSIPAPTLITRPTQGGFVPPTAFFPPTRVAGLPTGTPLPLSIGIISPAPGNLVAGTVQVIGAAIHPQFLQYILEFGPDPNPSNLWYPLTPPVTSPLLNGILGTWGTLGLNDATYQLRLRVFLRDGSQLVSTVNGLRVQNGLPTAVPTSTPVTLPPIANFTADRYSGPAPLTVRFTNVTSGIFSSSLWNFGDGSTRSDLNPVHTFNNPGLYVVTLTVGGPSGTSSYSAQITVQSAQPPIANFNATPLSGPAPLTVAFSDASTGTITSWFWTFSDGGSSTQRNPSHTFVNPGTYNVFLTVSGPGGAANVVRAITVGAPSITATPNLTQTAAFQATLNAQISAGVQATQDAINATATQNAINAGNAATATQNAINATATQQANNVQGTQVAQANIDAQNTQAALNAQATQTQEAINVQNTQVAQASLDAQATQAALNFQATQTQEAINAQGTQAALDFQATQAALAAQQPIAAFSAFPNGLSVQFDSSASQNAASHTWDFGDGQISGEANPFHTYLRSGTYTVSLTVFNSGGQASTPVQQVISVQRPAANVDFLPAMPVFTDSNVTQPLIDLYEAVPPDQRADVGAFGRTDSGVLFGNLAIFGSTDAFGNPAYNLGDNGYLQSAIDSFASSFTRPPICDADVSDFSFNCDFSGGKPALLLIAPNYGEGIDLGAFYGQLRNAVQEVVNEGVIPLLFTVAPVNNGVVSEQTTASVNDIIIQVANELRVPVFNSWASANSTPNNGLSSDGVNLSSAPNQWNVGDLSSGSVNSYGANAVNRLILEALLKLSETVLSNVDTGVVPGGGDSGGGPVVALNGALQSYDGATAFILLDDGRTIGFDVTVAAVAQDILDIVNGGSGFGLRVVVEARDNDDGTYQTLSLSLE
ncbi:MAG: PKD domain-containing protein [Anaerolineae bacterium]|nr:PKD domain-containing protein [Anaerolineae bacterium]MDW8173368.1 PKD domain-containing protein [Anaerolineae bacterium]